MNADKFDTIFSAEEELRLSEYPWFEFHVSREEDAGRCLGSVGLARISERFQRQTRVGWQHMACEMEIPLLY